MSLEILPAMFICVFDRELNVIRAVKIGGAYTDLVHQVYFSQNHEICIAGGFSGNVDFNPNISTNYVYAQNFDGFYLKWNFTNTANLEETDQRNMTVLNLNGWLEISGIDQISSIELISMNGSRVKPTTEWIEGKIRVYSDHLSNGVYFLSVVTPQMEFIQKVVIVK